MEIVIRIDTSTAAFEDYWQGEVSRILQELSRQIRNVSDGWKGHQLRDANNKTIGSALPKTRMKAFRIERTELHTRVWFVRAATEDDALEAYTEEAENEEASYHSGEPDVRITESTQPFDEGGSD